MIRALLAIALLAPASAQDADLTALLARMEARRKGFQDFRATFSTWQPLQLKTGRTELRRWSGGPLMVRASGDAAWTVRGDRAPWFFSDALDAKAGVRAAIRGNEFVLHAPCGLHLLHGGPGRQQNVAYGATWFRNALDADSPPTVPMLASDPDLFPVILLYDLAPSKYLATLPGLKRAATRKENGREYVVLTAANGENGSLSRKEEAWRTWNALTWIGAEIWVDAADARIDRMRFRHQNSSSAPIYTWFKEYRFAKLEKIGGVEGVPTSIEILNGLEGEERDWNSRIDLADVKVNGGVTEADVTLQPPGDRLVRDWHLQMPIVYEKRPGDAGAWLGLAALRMHTFEHAEAEKAFRKVMELKPQAEEGYLGYVSWLEASQERDPAKGVEVLEKGIQAGVKSDELRWELAHRVAARDPALARKYFEGLLATRPEAAEILVEMALAAAREPVDQRALYVRALQGELAGAPPSSAWWRWKETQPTDKDRQAMLQILETAIRKEDRIQPRLWILDLREQMGKTEEVRRHAAAVLALIEKNPQDVPLYVVDRVHEVFRAAKDAEALKRLEKAFAMRADDDGEIIRLALEAERQVAQGDVDAWVKYFDTRIMPSQKGDLKAHFQPCSRFLSALKRDKKLAAFLEKLFVTPPEDPNRTYHQFVARYVGNSHFEGSERTQFELRLRQLENGPAASVNESINFARTLMMEKKWKEARAKIEEILAQKDVKGDPRASAERSLAYCFEGTGEFEKAYAASGRALDETAVGLRSSDHLFRAKMKAALKDAPAAVLSYAMAFEDAEKASPPSRRWGSVHSLLREIPYQTRDAAMRKPLLDAAEESAPKAPAGMQATLGVLRMQNGNAAGAADAFQKARELWKDDPVLLRWHLKEAAAALQLDKAMSLRAELVPRIKAEKDNLRDYELTSLGQVNSDVARACIRKPDPAAAKAFARALAQEPISNDTNFPLAELLQYLKDEKFIAEIDEALVKGASSEWERFYAHYPAAATWHALGRTDRAVAFYRDVTEAKGWSRSYAQVADAWIKDWEKGSKK